MGTSVAVVIDISSDEEEEEEKRYDYKRWTSAAEVEKATKEDCDDSDDDDCLILDDDPDKPVKVQLGGRSAAADDDDDDDLIVVEEKGQVACRDFPHSRHLCVSFPFSSTSHEKHCSLCHCYVCDSLAPCVYWGNGASLTDHCHATDIVETWNTKRKLFKEKSAPISIPVACPTPTQPSILNQSHPCSASSVGSPACPTPSQPSILNQSHPCSASSVASPVLSSHERLSQHPARPQTPTQPSILNQSHPCSASSVASPVLSSCERLSQHLARPQPSTTGTQNVQREKHGTAAFSLSVKQPNTQFKRARSPGSGLVNSSTMHSQYMLSCENQVVRSLPQKPHYPEEAALSRSGQQPVISQTSQHIPVTSQRSQHMDVTSQRSKHMPETSQRSQRVPVTSQRSQFPPIEQIYQCMPESSHPPYIPEMISEHSIRKWQDLVARIKSEHGFSDNITGSSTPMQPYAASSRPICVGNLTPPHINYGQQMGFHHVGSSEMLSAPVDFNGKWLNGTAVDNFTGGGEPAVQPSPSVASWNPASASAHYGSQSHSLSTNQQAVPGLREEYGLQGMVPTAPGASAYPYGSTWW